MSEKSSVKDEAQPTSDIPTPPSEEPNGTATSTQETSNAPTPKPSPIVKPLESGKPKETPSIFGKKKKKETAEEVSPVKDKKETDFSEEELQKAWSAFAEQKTDTGDTEKLILGKKIKKGENHSVILMLGSQLEVSFLEKFDTELVQFLRNELHNDHIVIRTEIEEIKDEKKLYTSKDIFDYMVKENPDLKDLKDRLGLDY